MPIDNDDDELPRAQRRLAYAPELNENETKRNETKRNNLSENQRQNPQTNNTKINLKRRKEAMEDHVRVVPIWGGKRQTPA